MNKKQIPTNGRRAREKRERAASHRRSRNALRDMIKALFARHFAPETTPTTNTTSTGRS